MIIMSLIIAFIMWYVIQCIKTKKIFMNQLVEKYGEDAAKEVYKNLIDCGKFSEVYMNWNYNGKKIEDL